MLKPTVKTNIIKKLNCGKLKYIELNNILRKQTWKVFTWLERQWRLVAVFCTCSHRRRCPTRWLTRYLSADLGLSWRSSARLQLRLVSFTSIINIRSVLNHPIDKNITSTGQLFINVSNHFDRLPKCHWHLPCNMKRFYD